MIGRFENRLAKGDVTAILRRNNQAGLEIDVVFGVEAWAFDDADVGVVKQPIEQRGSERGVVVEDFSHAWSSATPRSASSTSSPATCWWSNRSTSAYAFIKKSAE